LLKSEKKQVSKNEFILFYAIHKVVFARCRLPICEIWCEIYLLFHSLAYFTLPFFDVRNFSDRK